MLDLIESFASACDLCEADMRRIKEFVDEYGGGVWTSAEVAWLAARHAQVHVGVSL